MAYKFVNSVKYAFAFIVMLIAAMACEKDFQDIGVGLVDNNLFSTKDTIIDVVAYNRNVDSSQVNGILSYLLGVYKDNNFGKFKASFVSQVGLNATTFGDSVAIDTIILDIPYYATKLDDGSFELDSTAVWGDTTQVFKLSVYELGTYLNSLNPDDPTKNRQYYSNESYNKIGPALYSGDFLPNANDTVSYVKRWTIDRNRTTMDDIDTITKSTIAPSIKIPLDTAFFRSKFINEQDSYVFSSSDAFLNYFRGLYIEPEFVGDNGSVMALKLAEATLNIYYTNSVETIETTADLNNDGDMNDTLFIRTKQTKSYLLSGVMANKFERDYNASTSVPSITSYFTDANKEQGQDKLFVQGAAGSEAVIELFKDANALNNIRNQNWLINAAYLTFKVDNEGQNNMPARLYLYNYDNKSQLRDAITEMNFAGIGGALNEDNNPAEYKFSITDYISEVLKSDDPEKVYRLGLKVFNSFDDYGTQTIDTIIGDKSWIPDGVVLKGSKIGQDQTDYNNRIKLEIYYTVNNN